MRRAVGCLVAVLLLASAGAAEERWPSIEWAAPEPEVQGFVVERRSSPTAKRALVARLGPDARRFEDRSAPADASRLCYVVRAILRDGRWSPSEEHCVETGVARAAPAGPVVAVEVVAVDPTAVPVEAAEPEPTAVPVEAAEPEPTAEPVEVAEPEPPAESVEVAEPEPVVPAEVAEPEPVVPAEVAEPEPVPVDVAAPPLEEVDVAAPAPAVEPRPAGDASPEAAEPAEAAPAASPVERPRISDRFEPVPAERFLDRLDVGPSVPPADEDEPLR